MPTRRCWSPWRTRLRRAAAWCCDSTSRSGNSAPRVRRFRRQRPAIARGSSGRWKRPEALTGGRVFAGGHSYGGRQSTMAAAERAGMADGLLLLSYPLHPPKRPEQKRTAHFPQLRTPALFVHGTADPFGSIEDLREAVALIPAPDRCAGRGRRGSRPEARGGPRGRDPHQAARARVGRVISKAIATTVNESNIVAARRPRISLKRQEDPCASPNR